MQHRISGQLFSLIAFSAYFSTLPIPQSALVSLSQSASDDIPGAYFAEPILSDAFSKADTPDSAIRHGSNHRCTTREIRNLFSTESAALAGTRTQRALLPRRRPVYTAPKQGPPQA